MDIVLGVSVTATTVRMVLIEGENADGVIIEYSTFDTAEGAVKASPSEQIGAAILATQKNAVSKGHHLVLSGVTWDDAPASAGLSDGLAARDLQNVVLVAAQNSAGALARTVGRALGYDTTAVMVMTPETATLSIVDSDDGSIVEAQMCTLDSANATDILPAMAMALEGRNPKPGSVFVVGSRAAVCAVKSSLERQIAQPVIVPEEPEFALARGAALAAANVPCADASTCGLAYSKDPDELGALGHVPVKLADADTQAALFDSIGSDSARTLRHGADPRVRIPFGSVAAATLVIGAVASAMMVAASVQDTAGRDTLAAGAADSSALVTEPPVAQPAAAVPTPAVLPAPKPQSIPMATPVAQPPPAAPSPAPTVQKRAPVVRVRQPVPSRVIAEPTPVAVEKPLPAAPIAVEPVEALPAPAPAVAPTLPLLTAPSPPALSAPPIFPAPAVSPAAPTPPVASSPWTPPWLRFGTPPAGQQTAQPAQRPQLWPGLQINLWPQQQAPQPQRMPQVPQWTPAQVPQRTPSLVPQWTPAPLIPQWRPAPSAQPPQIPATPRSRYPYPMQPGPSIPADTYLLPPTGLEPTLGGF
jgi:hypothetical protein